MDDKRKIISYCLLISFLLFFFYFTLFNFSLVLLFSIKKRLNCLENLLHLRKLIKFNDSAFLKESGVYMRECFKQLFSCGSISICHITIKTIEMSNKTTLWYTIPLLHSFLSQYDMSISRKMSRLTKVFSKALYNCGKNRK